MALVEEASAAPCPKGPSASGAKEGGAEWQHSFLLVDESFGVFHALYLLK